MLYCIKRFNHQGHLLRNPQRLPSTPWLFGVQQFPHQPLPETVFKTAVEAASAETFCSRCGLGYFTWVLKTARRERGLTAFVISLQEGGLIIYYWLHHWPGLPSTDFSPLPHLKWEMRSNLILCRPDEWKNTTNLPHLQGEKANNLI